MASTSVNEELWRIFSFYSLEYGDKNDPEHLDSSQFLKFCTECNLITRDFTREDINLLFTTQTKKSAEEEAQALRDAADPALAAAGAGGATPPVAPGAAMGTAIRAARDHGSRRRELNMDFGNFLRTLAVIAMRTNEMTASDQLEVAVQELLHKQVLPNGERRLPAVVATQLQSEDIVQLKRWFAPQLKTVFAHYADAYDRRCRQVGRPTQRRSCMGYTELVQFAADCRLTSLPRLSRLEVGKIYLASAPCPANSPGKRYTHLRFSHFWEALVRFAMLAFSEMRSRQDIGEQVCGLFLVMWRTLSEAQVRGAKGPPARTDYLQQIYKSFLERFFAFWAHDNHREYLVEQQGPAARAPDVLSRLMGEQVAAPSADTRQTVGDRLRAHAQNARDTRAEYAYE